MTARLEGRLSRPVTVAAIDLGASGGRVIAGRVAGDSLELLQTHRFPNIPVRLLGMLHWDVLRLFGDILEGLRRVSGTADLASIGVDSWGVDYGLIGPAGQLLANPVQPGPSAPPRPSYIVCANWCGPPSRWSTTSPRVTSSGRPPHAASVFARRPADLSRAPVAQTRHLWPRSHRNA
jgi:hypothetical protein